MKRILITGAAGQIGRCLRASFKGVYDELRLADIAPQEPAGAGETVLRTDIRDLAAMEEAMRGIDCVMHLAGMAGEADWASVRDLNIDGCYNAYEAARRQGVKRFIFASSNHAIGFHRRTRLLDDQVVPRPDTRYGVSKVFGEALGRMYADKHAMQVACLRIGTFKIPDEPEQSRQLLSWISHRDMAQLVRCCIDATDFHFIVAYGVSNNKRSRWSNQHVDFLGYAPQDDSEAYASAILAKGIVEDPLAAPFHGGFYCPMEFDGDIDLID